MTRHATLLACGLALATFGCAGALEPSGPGDELPASPDAGVEDPGEDPPSDASTARALYEANVHGVLLAACGGCHGTQDPAFTAQEKGEGYQRVTAQRDRLYSGYDPVTARIVVNGAGQHYGVTYAPGDRDAITAWLAAEETEAAGGGQEASPLAIWSGCMDLDEWNAEGVAAAWSNKGSQDGNCETCHNLGAEGFMASDQSQRVFDSITQIPALMPSYFTLDATGTNVIINRTRLENVALKVAPHEEHPGFQVDGDAMDRLQRFYNLTLARYQAGDCGPPRFPE